MANSPMLRSPMNEIQRQYYLSQCGITLWYARRPMPGAAASAAQDFSRVSGKAASPAATRLRPGLTEQLVSASGPGLAQSRPSEPIVRPQSPDLSGGPQSRLPDPVPARPLRTDIAEAVATPAATSTLLPDLDLRIVVSPRLIIIGEAGGEVSSDSQDRLLKNITGAMGCAIPLDELHRFAWPVFGNRRVPGNDDAGLESVLNRKFAGMLELPMLGIGPNTDSVLALLKPGADMEKPGQRLIFGSSLGSVAASGQLKRELWKLIVDSGLAGNTK